MDWRKYTDMECSSFPEGNWHECCVEHDFAYVMGTGKLKADIELLV